MEKAKILLKIKQHEPQTRQVNKILITEWTKIDKEISYGKYEVVGKGPKPLYSINDVCLCICSYSVVSKRLEFFIIGYLSFRWIVGRDLHSALF